MARWNRTTLLKACEDVLMRDDVRLELREVNGKNLTAGFEGDYDPRKGITNIVITVDQDQGGLIESVLHELLHIVLDDMLNANFNSALEEKMVKALEVDLFVRAIRQGNLKRWRKLIDSKL
jgi:hypothetical protein